MPEIAFIFIRKRPITQQAPPFERFWRLQGPLFENRNTLAVSHEWDWRETAEDSLSMA